MKYLGKLSLSLILVCILTAAVFAGETGTSPSCAPGETAAPPCSSQSPNDDPAVPGETSAPLAAPVVYVTDIAETLLWSLLLF